MLEIPSILFNKEKLLEQVYMRHVVEKRVEGKKAFFVNLCDIHQGLNNRALLRAFAAFVLSIPNFYIGIGGDSTNLASKVSKGNPKEEYASGDEQLYALVEDLMPLFLAGRILYIIEGNHGSGRYKDTIGYCPEKMLAKLLGDEKLYKGAMAILYFNVNDRTYVHMAQHVSPKKQDYFAWVNADVVWKEHHHLLDINHKIVLEHNKYQKKPIVKQVLEIFGGNWQVLPDYSIAAGYRPVMPGCYVVEMSGEKWKLHAWRDEQFAHMIKNGYAA